MLQSVVVSSPVLCSSMLQFYCINLRCLLSFWCWEEYAFSHMLCHSITVSVIIVLSSILFWCVGILLYTSKCCLIAFMSCVVSQFVEIYCVRLLCHILLTLQCVVLLYIIFSLFVSFYVTDSNQRLRVGPRDFPHAYAAPFRPSEYSRQGTKGTYITCS